jgi:peptidoglycan/xylan/chitin deacetylase (PgdA/CDA1 family)
VTLKTAKIATLRFARGAGLFSAVRSSLWRSRRLLILCYHGLSFADEHLWNPALYVEASRFRARMQALRDGGYRVLPLDEALRRLADGTLPPRSVAITFDDGGYSFGELALPVLREFQFPSTVYLASYYCRRQLPVFDVTCSYLIWKGNGRISQARELIPGSEACPVDRGSQAVLRWWRHSISGLSMSASEKEDLAARLAASLGLDYGHIRDSRMFHLMNPEEVAGVSRHNVNIELHTHRHRTPRDQALFTREIVDNRKDILEMTGKNPTHFCYPSGDYVSEYFAWLRQAGVESATTCESGFAFRGQELMRIPRLLDTTSLSEIEFEGWLTGVSAALPQR